MFVEGRFELTDEERALVREFRPEIKDEFLLATAWQNFLEKLSLEAAERAALGSRYVPGAYSYVDEDGVQDGGGPAVEPVEQPGVVAAAVSEALAS